MQRPDALLALFLLALVPLASAHIAAQVNAETARDREQAREHLMIRLRHYADPIDEPADPRVVAAMRQVPRHLFVPSAVRDEAYEDHPLPIGEGQTISQPSLVALMTHLLHTRRDHVVLEVGTGSGYQAAILTRLVRSVFSIEIVGPLARQADRRLSELGYDNVVVRHGDGYAGWPAHAPFDGIIVTAGADHVPQPLVDQLKPGGRLIIPVGSCDGAQELRLIVKDEAGRVHQKSILGVRFVPLTGGPRR